MNTYCLFNGSSSSFAFPRVSRNNNTGNVVHSVEMVVLEGEM